MRLLMIGAPGAGKGTQAVRIAQHFRVTHISSGDLLRKHVTEQTSIGKQISRYMEAGDLVPDSVVMDLLRKPIVSANAAGGYVLDGFPRTLEQAQAAYKVAVDLGVAVQVVVHLVVPHDELVRRLLERGADSGRSDDNLETIEHRLQVYDAKTLPMLDYYAEREQLITVDGARAVDEVSQGVTTALEDLRGMTAES
ncbi:MAG TPA: adenylate kinase [Sporichthyaceae bacterium]|jgi:adenylate kinase|nr:adenylate kinase [Sporichthyaceae bacterium]